MKADDPLDQCFAELGKCSEMPRVEVSDAVRHQCTRNLNRCEHRSRARRVLFSSLLLLGGALLFGRAGGCSPTTTSAAMVGMAAWGFALAAVLLGGLALAPHRHPSKNARCCLLVLLPALFLAGLGLLAGRVGSVTEFVAAQGIWRALPCCGFAIVGGSAISGAIMLLWRRTDPFNPGLTGAAVGLMGGLAGAIGVGLACPSANGWHLWLGHGVTLGAVALLGWLLGRRLLAP